VDVCVCGLDSSGWGLGAMQSSCEDVTGKWVSQKAGKFLTSCGAISFSKIDIHEGVCTYKPIPDHLFAPQFVQLFIQKRPITTFLWHFASAIEKFFYWLVSLQMQITC
jgi:hypothetical protein